MEQVPQPTELRDVEVRWRRGTLRYIVNLLHVTVLIRRCRLACHVIVPSFIFRGYSAFEKGMTSCLDVSVSSLAPRWESMRPGMSPRTPSASSAPHLPGRIIAPAPPEERRAGLEHGKTPRSYASHPAIRHYWSHFFSPNSTICFRRSSDLRTSPLCRRLAVEQL